VYAILADASPGEERVALLRAGVLDEYYIHRPGAPDGIGDVHVGRVTSVLPAMAGAFVALTDAEGFLPDTEGAAGLSEGAHVVVRVMRAAQGGKGPRLTARLSGDDAAMAADKPVRRLRAGPSPLQELREAFAEAAVIRGPFPASLADDIDALGSESFALPGGMRANATATAALTAIDLDGGATTAARAAKAGAQMAANLAALPALARHIRLRNFSGAILVDFAGLPARRRAALAAPLQAALEADRLRPRLAGFSNLGFAEIVRPRRRPPLHEQLRGPLAAGLAALRRAAAEAAAAPARRLALRAAPAVVAALQADAAALADLAKLTAHPLVLRSDAALPAHTWLIEDRLG
jgi:Ribonuclease G/E